MNKKTQYVITSEHDYLADTGTKDEVVGVTDKVEEVPEIISKAIQKEREAFPLLDEHLSKNPEDALILTFDSSFSKKKISYWDNTFVLKMTVIEPSVGISTSEGEPEILTFGLLKELMGARNIPTLKTLVYGRDDSEIISRLEDMDKYIAHTLWTKEDIEDCLVEDGYAPSAENVDAVLATGCLKYLGDCTDADWYAIHEAISRANLAKRRAPELLNKGMRYKKMVIPMLTRKKEVA